MKKSIGIIFGLLLIVSMFPAFATKDAGEYAYLKATLLNQDPDPAEPGELVELRWKIVKFGNADLGNITLTLEPGYPFWFMPTASADTNLGDWRGYSFSDEYYTLYHKLRVDDDATEATYTMKLHATYTYNNKVNTVMLGEYEVRVGDKQRPEFVLGTLVTSPTKLVSDTDEAQLDIEIANIGDDNAENVQVQMMLQDGFTPTYSYSDISNLGTITAGGSDTATFYLDINENVRLDSYSSELVIKYKEAGDDKNEYKTKKITLDIPIMRKPTFEMVSVESTPKKIIPGSVIQLKMTVKNTGGDEAESVSVRAFKESSQPFEFDEKTDFIGKLKPGETGEAVIKFTVDQDAKAKEYLMDIEIRTIHGDDVLVEEKSVGFTIEEDIQDAVGFTEPITALFGAGGKSPLPGVALIIVILVLIAVFYYLGRSRGKDLTCKKK